MPIATIHFVTWISRGRRHHGSAYSDIAPATTSTLTAGDTFQPPWAPPSISWTNSSGKVQTAVFAFWSVTGGVNGGIVSTPDSNTAPPVTVGDSPIVATAWYVQPGGGGHGTGVSIDAFDVNQGMFVDDDFVAVTTDPTLSQNANEDGFVPTAEAENIEAFGQIHGVPFTNWKVVVGDETVSYLDLGVTIGTNAVAFAFYHLLKFTLPKDVGSYAQITHIYFGVINDGPGRTDRGPVGPWDPLVRQFAAGLALATAASSVNEKLQGELRNLAAAQVTLSAESIVQSIMSIS